MKIKFIKQKTVLLLLGIVMSSNAISARTSEQIIGGIVGGIIGSTITQIIYDGHRNTSGSRGPSIYYNETYPTKEYRYRRQRHNLSRAKYHRRHKSIRKVEKKIKKKRASTASQKIKKTIKSEVPTVVPLLKTLSNAKKIQKALAGLGFYNAQIDGELNSYETHSAIRRLYERYEIYGDKELTIDLRRKLKNIGDLFLLDRALIAKNHTAASQIMQLQTALKIHGHYKGEIDGIMGGQTRQAIIDYNESNSYENSTHLNLESKYHLVKSAKMKNEKTIDLILSSFGQKHNLYSNDEPLLQTRLQ